MFESILYLNEITLNTFINSTLNHFQTRFGLIPVPSYYLPILFHTRPFLTNSKKQTKSQNTEQKHKKFIEL